MQLVCLASLLSLLIGLSSARCPHAWTEYGNSCYLLIAENVPWTSAWVMCRTLYSQLLKVETAEENSFILGLIKSRNGVDNVWMGLVDYTQEGRWTWLQEDPSREPEEPSFTNWAHGEPNNQGPGQSCAVVRGTDGSWDDVVCESTTSIRSPACEMPIISHEGPVVG